MIKRFRNISLILFTLVVLLAQIVAPAAALANGSSSTYKLTQTGLAASYPTRALWT